MKLRRIVIRLVFVMVAAVLSVFLALRSEGLAYHYGFTTGTPGEIVSCMVVPASG